MWPETFTLSPVAHLTSPDQRTSLQCSSKSKQPTNHRRMQGPIPGFPKHHCGPLRLFPCLVSTQMCAPFSCFRGSLRGCHHTRHECAPGALHPERGPTSLGEWARFSGHGTTRL